MYPTLLFSLSYTEESDAFAGGMIIRNGEIVSESETSCDFDEMVSEHEHGSDEWYDDYCEWREKVIENVDNAQNSMLCSVMENLDWYEDNKL
jgi:hypothetical protein